MALTGKTVLVLGGWGLVGRAVSYELLQDNPKLIVVGSLKRAEAEEAVHDLENERDQRNEGGETITTRIVAEWGDIFSRTEFKDLDARQIDNDRDLDKIIDDTFNDLKKVDLNKMYLYQLITKYRPEVVVDSINTATIVAYKDVYAKTLDVRRRLAELEKAHATGEELTEPIRALGKAIRQQLTSIYLPRLIRHVQIMYLALQKARTEFFVKIGTTGTGGMGLNIPYTHSEEKPSQKLLSKSAVAGAHSLLLFLLSNTPDTAFTIEIKPAAAIAWKSIGFGDIRRGTTPICLYDNPPRDAFPLGDHVVLDYADPKETEKPGPRIKDKKKCLEAVYINTGENGLFSHGEFTAITTTGQMEYVTPEEIARDVRAELLGSNTGHDIVTALKNSIMTSTYRAGFMRDFAIEELTRLEKKKGEAVAFEILGPPRLSKLLYEAFLLKKAYGTAKKITAPKAEDLAARLEALVAKDATLRQRILSIGIPILLPDGKRLLRGPKLVSPPPRGDNHVPVNAETLEQYVEDGWVDLRPCNMEKWQQRMCRLLDVMETADWTKDDANTSSRLSRARYCQKDGKLNIGEVVGWIFNTEEGGSRAGYAPIRARRKQPLR